MGLGCAGHAVAGGVVTASGAGLAAALLVGPMWLAGRRELSAPMIALLLVLGQFTVHAAFLGTHAPVDHGSDLSWSMWVAHTAVGALLALWLRVGERRLWRAARRCLDALPPALPRSPLAVGPRSPRPAVPAARALLRHAIVHRGPPVMA